MSFWEMSQLVFCYFRHKVFNLALLDCHQIIFHVYFKDKCVHWLHEQVLSFLLQADDLFHPELLQILHDGKHDHHVVLASSSPDFLVGPIANQLGLTHWIGSIYAINDHQRASYLKKLVDGKAKAEYVQDLAKTLQVPLNQMTFYTDSILDLPLLEIVGKKVCVNPDRKLTQLAELHNWEIMS